MRKNRMILKVLIISCLFLIGCGNKEEQKATEAENVNETQMTNTPEENEAASEVQEQYQELAKENLSLQEQKAELTQEYAYYEQLVLAHSAEDFSDKDVLSELVESAQDSTVMNVPTTSEEQAGVMEESNDEPLQETITIEEVDDAEAEKRIEELKAENEELSTQISELQKEIEALKIQSMAN